MALAESHHIHLTFPNVRGGWLPGSLAMLRLECPTLTTLPGCLTELTALSSLEVNTRRKLTNYSQLLAHTGGWLSGRKEGVWRGKRGACTACAWCGRLAAKAAAGC